MKIAVLVAEIGSTTTVVNAFDGIGGPCPVFLGQGQASTTVLQGDVTVGLRSAVEDLRLLLGADSLEWDEMFATSSAAGGLRMTVHGLVRDMTVRAAREAALGAGAILKYITAGRLRRTEAARIREIAPNIILVAGGVDFGERDTALFNFETIASLGLDVPVIYAGNVENQDEIALMAEESGVRLYITENVYPRVDQLNVDPARRIIQKVFEDHIVHAPGMNTVRDMIDGPIIPTPGAVMEAAILLRDSLGDLVVFDIGGATTDVHSVAEGSEKINAITITPEPVAKRTVEGDLGVYLNLDHIAEQADTDRLLMDFPDLDDLIARANPIPESERETRFIERMAREALTLSLQRHTGVIRHYYTATGKKTIAEGKDLTAVEYVIGTGGALTRLPGGRRILEAAGEMKKGLELYPPAGVKALVDRDYIMASLGVLAKRYPEDALTLLRRSLGLDSVDNPADRAV